MNLYLQQVCLHEPYLVDLNDNMNEFNFVRQPTCVHTGILLLLQLLG